jgi:hypothetical protein
MLGINLVHRTRGILTSQGWPVPYAVEAEIPEDWKAKYKIGAAITHEKLPFNKTAALIDIIVLLAMVAITSGIVHSWQILRNTTLQSTAMHMSTPLFFFCIAAIFLGMNLIEYGEVCCGDRISAGGHWPSLGWPALYYQYVTYDRMRFDTTFTDHVIGDVMIPVGLTVVLAFAYNFFMKARETTKVASRQWALWCCPILAAGTFILLHQYYPWGRQSFGWPLEIDVHWAFFNWYDEPVQDYVCGYTARLVLNVIAGLMWVLFAALLTACWCYGFSSKLNRQGDSSKSS